MHHSHFHSLDSTQIFLRENLEKLKSIDSNILISASKQTAGIGRNSKDWDFYERSLAMSFTLTPNLTPTLTPLEIAILTVEFFENTFSLKILIKWPNDLMTPARHKCGGILSQYIDSQTVIAGLGLNFSEERSLSAAPADYKHGLGFLNIEPLKDIEQKDLALKIYQYMLKNRVPDFDELKVRFEKHCSHIGASVEIDDDQVLVEGIFKTIGKHGEAIVQTRAGLKSFLSSSLRLKN